ncbi:MAG: hypothetical protein HY433_01825 [Candidatus Liptonbacteria bacterium]|nr:hypothetical protein [Candidatus Liptonbacteria bacterium]
MSNKHKNRIPLIEAMEAVMREEARKDYSIVRNYCPGCEVNADPFAELLQESWCSSHKPSLEGDKDKKVQSLLGKQLYNSTEGDGETGRAYAESLNRKKEA